MKKGFHPINHSVPLPPRMMDGRCGKRSAACRLNLPRLGTTQNKAREERASGHAITRRSIVLSLKEGARGAEAAAAVAW